ncbi:M60 family metallopeptidase [Pedobacter sp. MC2016-05]|uniref:M60 family metallopeptidase n=1 Tax=Pedobacter sp. MC2016-05 TaxID=2994474 RepID=UPI0022465C16|nr:M60 family metallopeptidase [Pedobacter sp. MC2016-05]MCX2473763.1 M60 family metallopeptidase [Pedobacter sp. MC2016-05]
MKRHKIKYLALAMIVVASACKKYGYEVADGYPDNSGNVADGKIDTTKRDIDKTMYQQARVFPGLVSDSEPRVGQGNIPAGKFSLDLNFSNQTKATLRFSYAPTAMFSTGYYAAPGELVKIVVPQGLDGLSVQIGVHTQDLSAVAQPRRYPVVFARQQLYAGDNFVRNLFGGTIYIIASRSYQGSGGINSPNPVEFTIANACVSPDFILNDPKKGDNADWAARVRASTVPWLELTSKSVIWTVPRSFILQKMTSSSDPLNNPKELMSQWDKIYGEHYNGWMGLSESASDPIDRVPASAWRATVDIQMPVADAYGLAGFPFMALYGFYDDGWLETWTSLNQLVTNKPKPNWGTYHELGHNTQQVYWSNPGTASEKSDRIWEWSILTEATCNLFSFKIAKAYGVDFKDLGRGDDWLKSGLAFVVRTGTKNFDTEFGTSAAGSGQRLMPFVQLLERYGYGWFTELHKQGRRITRPNTNDQARKDYFYEFICNYTKVNLLPFFNAWGIQVSTPSQAVINAQNYPLLNEPLWGYNTLEYIGPVSASSTESAQPVTNLTNGNDADYWSSQTTGTLPASANYPFNLVFYVGSKTQNIANIKGVRIVQRNSATSYVGQVEVQVSNDNVSYTSVGTMQVPQNATPYNFTFATGAKQAKFMKLIVKTGTGTRSISLAEVRAIY